MPAPACAEPVFAVPSVRRPVPETPAAVELWPLTAWPIGAELALVWPFDSCCGLDLLGLGLGRCGEQAADEGGDEFVHDESRFIVKVSGIPAHGRNIVLGMKRA